MGSRGEANPDAWGPNNRVLAWGSQEVPSWMPGQYQGGLSGQG